MSKPEEAPPPQRPWAILSSVPDVVVAAHLPRGKDLSLFVNNPPSVSVLKVARGFIPNIKPTLPPPRYPYIAAADPSGRLLLCASHLSDWWPYTTMYDIDPQLIFDDDNKLNTYFLCDATTQTVSELPARVDPDGPILHSGNVGLIRRDDGQFMVAELQPKDGTDDATLLCHWAGTDGWVTKKLQYSPEHPMWGSNGAISHAGKLWWIDLSYGLLTCDPFAEQPDLRYIPLPQGCVLPVVGRKAYRDDVLLALDKRRCVKVSDGKLRYVQIDDGADDASKLIRMWTLADPDSTEWTLQYVAQLTDIWEDEIYRETGLQREVPVLALVHPWNPDVVYFWQDRLIFAVDVPTRKVLSCKHFVLAACLPWREFPSSRLVHAWELPPTLLRDHDGPGGWLSNSLSRILSFWRPAKGRASSASSSGAGD